MDQYSNGDNSNGDQYSNQKKIGPKQNNDFSKIDNKDKSDYLNPNHLQLEIENKHLEFGDLFAGENDENQDNNTNNNDGTNRGMMMSDYYPSEDAKNSADRNNLPNSNDEFLNESTYFQMDGLKTNFKTLVCIFFIEKIKLFRKLFKSKLFKSRKIKVFPLISYFPY